MMAPPKKSSVMFALLAVFLCYCCGSSHNFVVAVDNNDDSNSKGATKARTNFLRRSMTGNQVDVVVVVNDAVAKDQRELMPSNNKCGCSTCTQEVLNDDADGYSCGGRIDWMVSSMEYSEKDACNLVAGEEFPSVCGGCHTAQCREELIVTELIVTERSRCGCEQCTDAAWNTIVTDAGGSYSCGSRIDWMISSQGYDESTACSYVSDEFPDICTCSCDDDDNNTASPITPLDTQTPTTEPPTGSSSSFDSNFESSFESTNSPNEEATVTTTQAPTTEPPTKSPTEEPTVRATQAPTTEPPTNSPTEEPTVRTTQAPTTEPPTNSPTEEPTVRTTQAPTTEPPTNSPTEEPTVRATQAPTTEPPTSTPIEEQTVETTSRCGCEQCTDAVWNTIVTDAGGSYSCGSRIDWMKSSQEYDESKACSYVSDEFPGVCTCTCGGSSPSSPPPPPPPIPTPSVSGSGTVKVMSYNTQYTGYYGDGRIVNFAQKIAEVAADVVGLQECQDANALVSLVGSPYKVLSATGRQNYILYNANRVEYLESGSMNIPSDTYAQRALTWGKFRVLEGSGAGNEFWFFNTHLPHNLGAAADRNTHARIGQMLLEKRIQLGAGSSPTIVVGDCNPFASSGASNGSFESNLAQGGIKMIYTVTGIDGGFGGLDKIFASEEHWTGSGADVGTGSSDHSAIIANLSLK